VRVKEVLRVAAKVVLIAMLVALGVWIVSFIMDKFAEIVG
jgi:hypothetical protein